MLYIYLAAMYCIIYGTQLLIASAVILGIVAIIVKSKPDFRVGTKLGRKYCIILGILPVLMGMGIVLNYVNLSASLMILILGTLLYALVLLNISILTGIIKK